MLYDYPKCKVCFRPTGISDAWWEICSSHIHIIYFNFFFSDQSTCVLCIWRKHLTMSLGIFCGRSLRSMGCLARCYKPFGPYKTVATAWSVEPAISWTRSRLVSARAALCDRLCSWFFYRRFPLGQSQNLISALCRWCGSFWLYYVMASSSHLSGSQPVVKQWEWESATLHWMGLW